MTRPRMSSRWLMLTAAPVVVLAIVLAGCATVTPEPATPSSSSTIDSDFLADYDLAGYDAQQVIERLDTMAVADRPADLIASVQPDVLVLTGSQQRETRLPMPEDEVYISVAPYQSRTHDCYFHSLTTCLGELTNREVHVTLTSDTGEVLIDEVRQTYDNGFIGFWVPRGAETNLTVGYQGRTGTAPISTMNDDDPTCITTLQLR